MSPDVDGIKRFDKDDQAAKHFFILMFGMWPGHLYQKFHQHQETLSTQNNNILQ